MQDLSKLNNCVSYNNNKTICVSLDSWAGRTKHKVEFIKETPKRYLIKWIEDSVFRFKKGNVYYIPKYATSMQDKS